jgi:hypothetical protein
MGSYRVIFLLVILCVGICGCIRDTEFCDESRSYPYWSEWTDGRLVSIVNDSLAVVATYRHKTECIDVKGKYKEEITKKTRAGLFLVNYRVKQKPLLGDTLTEDKYYDLKIPKGDFKDSSVLVFDYDYRNFGFWKIGEKSIKLKELYNEPGYNLWDINGVSHWINKNIVLKSYSFLYVLDMGNGQIKSFNQENEWMSHEERSSLCYNDRFDLYYLSYIDDKVVCVRRANTPNYHELIVDGAVSDIASLSSVKFGWFGNYILQSSEYYGKILKIDTENFKFDEGFELWLYDDFSKFYKNDKKDDDFVSYSGRDLISTF